MLTRDFAERIADSAAGLSPAARRVARYFLDNREEVLVASAAALAAKTETSDATVVRTAKALGFSGLDELRRALADEIRTAPSPADRLTRTLGEVGDSLSAALTLTLDIHMRALDALRRRDLVELPGNDAPQLLREGLALLVPIGIAGLCGERVIDVLKSSMAYWCWRCA